MQVKSESQLEMIRAGIFEDLTLSGCMSMQVWVSRFADVVNGPSDVKSVLLTMSEQGLVNLRDDGTVTLLPRDNFFWSRRPGKFVHKMTGIASNIAFTFEGTAREWNEVLVETIIDARNHYRTKHGTNPDSIFVGVDVITLLESCVFYIPTTQLSNISTVAPELKGTLVGMNVLVDKNMPSNLVKCCVMTDSSPNAFTVTVIDLLEPPEPSIEEE